MTNYMIVKGLELRADCKIYNGLSSLLENEPGWLGELKE